jgi:Predicted membrane protein
MNNYCQKCGGQFKADDQFCQSCGAKISKEAISVSEINRDDNFIKKLFTGRIKRLDFLIGWLMVCSFWLIIFYALSSVIGVLGINNAWVNIIFVYILDAICLLFMLSLGSRRFHDLGATGWLSLLLILPGINFIAFIFLLFKRGNKEINKYGEESPKDFTSSLRAIIGLN